MIILSGSFWNQTPQFGDVPQMHKVAKELHWSNDHGFCFVSIIINRCLVAVKQSVKMANS